tara:strand:+ start:6501 stop:8732 length:2232 start_codon:yes stop_codon:yes gene_type:complete
MAGRQVLVSPHSFCTALLAGWLCMGVTLCWAEPVNLKLDNVLPDWSISGYNTYRADTFEHSGDTTASPYPNRGFQQFDDFNLNFSRQFSAYETVNAQISGTVDDSEYRTAKEGLIFERGYLTWEKGDVGIPFRMEFGDFFGNQTYRTLQRSLKGFQIELQPELFLGKRHSIQLFGGITNQNYRELNDEKDFFSGASWLIPETQLGLFSLTVVNNTTEPVNNNSKLSQTVYSMAWGKAAEYFQQKLEIEAEYALFNGDHSSGAEQHQKDEGFFAQLKGKSNNIPLTYRFRHERYGDDFRPNGSSITANQRSTEIHLGWRFSTGLSVRGRLQTFRTNWETINPTDRDVAGLTLSGTFIPAIQLSGTVGSFVSDNETRDDTTRSLTHSTNASFSLPIVDHWVGRFGGLLTEVDNRVSGDTTVSRQISVGVDHDFDISGFIGSISPSLVLRNTTIAGSVTTSDISPAMSLYLTKGNHNLALSHNTLLQDSRSLTGNDTDTHQTSLNYSYSWNSHQFQIEGNYFDRNPIPGDDTHAYRIGVSWTYNFDRPARAARPAQPVQQVSPEERGAAVVEASGSYNAVANIADLAPGMDMGVIQARLESWGIIDPLVRSGLSIYETPFIEAIDHRQRLGLISSNNELTKSVLAIEFDDLGDIDSTLQVYEEVRKVLFDRYGPPINRIEEGEFSSSLGADLRSGRFTRIIDWETKTGKLRFGIPFRTDGQVRMELIHASNFPTGENNFWSIEQLR